MSIRESLYEHLTSDSGVSALTTRCYHGIAPPDIAVPYITIAQVGAEHVSHTAGISGLARTIMQVECWDNYPSDVDDLADAVRLAMHKFNGTMGTNGAVDNRSTVKDVTFEGDLDFQVPPSDGSPLATYARRMDFGIWHTETTS